MITGPYQNVDIEEQKQAVHHVLENSFPSLSVTKNVSDQNQTSSTNKKNNLSQPTSMKQIGIHTSRSDGVESEVSIVGYLKSTPVKFQTLDDIIRGFPAVLNALKKRQPLTKSNVKQTPAEVRHKSTVTNGFHTVKIEQNFIPSATLSISQPNWKQRQILALSEEQTRIAQNALFGSDSENLGKIFDQTITRRDLKTLKGLTWLNDEVINYYLGMICGESGVNCYPRVHYFSTFFYEKLSKEGAEKMTRWTRKVNIFAYDIILIPIHLTNHWALATIDVNQTRIQYYDSLGGSNELCLALLYSFVTNEYKSKLQQQIPSTWRGQQMTTIPAQRNRSDCGVFCCQFSKYIAREWPIDFTQDNMPQFRTQMIYEIASKKLLY
ncbi:unnamed protein product [Didymodactylos carnosus]|uniref:Ubiquitin-like protease family profile domain-containing protein n=1 Tax=Didymodactylos carnosus TaxID=1234261 RepID=A0A813SL86_9BILA|nr:unnamed protein product [Didymodactylos carnosus]CAF0802287.1 unnamed protein product [Didymodactylos carnosus]CAF3582334.1 unnamed protein product [Didymodactylos carnosus]CAF3585708.1 unnamed protein product [Didymodactylos carnosus]